MIGLKKERIINVFLSGLRTTSTLNIEISAATFSQILRVEGTN